LIVELPTTGNQRIHKYIGPLSVVPAAWKIFLCRELRKQNSVKGVLPDCSRQRRRQQQNAA
jgi:hypothetical protein